MRISIKIGSNILAVAVLAGCGGSGGSSPAAVVTDTPASVVAPGSNTPTVQPTGSVQADTPVPVTIVQIDNSSAQPDVQPDQSVAEETVSEPSADISTAADAQGDTSDSSPTDSSPSDSVVEETIVADGADSVISDNSGTAQSSFCDAATTSAVSFEDYYTNSNPRFLRGTYVPFPASGFGWDGNNLCDMTTSFGVDVVEVLVPYVAQRPDIDGAIGANEWQSAAVAGTSNFETSFNDIDNLLLSPVPDYQDGTGYSSWKAMHDGTNLYIHVRTSSDRGVLFLDSEQPWHDDSFEIFIDGDNSKGEDYDGVNDFQVSLSADSDTFDPIISGMSAPGLGIFYKSVNEFQRHPEIEIAINMESAGIEIGKPFGFDVHINEDDNGGDRDAKWGWFENSGFDRSWFQPSVLGTLLLTDCADRDACGSYQQLSP